MSDERDTIRVLHVDDYPDFTELTATFLEREDDRFAVDTATTVDEALERLREAAVDCIVADFDMPGRNGIEFLESVRDDHPELPFILYTGKGSEEIASEAISTGVTDYLQKESGTGQYAVLAHRIENAVEQYQAREALEASQKRLSLFIDQSPLGVVEWDEAFDVVRLNDAAEEILGYTESELEGRSWEAIVPDAERDDVGEIVTELQAAEGGYHSVNENVRGDGERIVCEWHNRIVTDEDGETVAIFSQFQDVTERREHERELEQYEAYLEGSTDIITVLDESGIVRYQSPSVTRILGYDRGELVGRNGFDLVHPDDVDDAYAAFTDLVTEPGETVTIEARFRTADGEWRWLEVRGRNRLDDDAIEGIITNNRDITEQHEHRQELERTNALFSTLVEALPVGVLAEDTSRDVLVVNERLLELFGMPETPEAVVGVDCEQLAEDVSEIFVEPERFVERIDELVASPEPVDGEELALRDGRTLSRSYRPIERPDGGEGHLWMYRDVTEQNEREHRLARYSETLEHLQRTTQRLLEASDADEAIATVLETLEGVLEFDVVGIWLADDSRSRLEPVAISETSEELISEPPTYTPETTSLSWNAYAESTVRSIDDLHEHDERHNHDTPLRSELIVPLGEYGVLNIASTEPSAFTEQDEALVELWADTVTTALARLERERELREREHELVRERDRLEEFASIVSHDLRNPLNVAQARVDFAREEFDSDHLEEVARAHERMNALIDDLLTLARQGDHVSETEPVDLAALSEVCWRNVETAGATLRTRTERVIRADRSRLQQLLENLVRNAVEHGGEGVTVTVGDLEGGFYVEDDGPGIPEEVRADVFSPGYSTSADGTGFGLSIVEQVATAHGWTIRLATSADGGARFEVTGVEVVEH